MLTVGEIADAIEQRANGDFAAADNVWADEVVVWRNGSQSEFRVAGKQRNERARAELEVLQTAMPDFHTESVVHVDESASVIVEFSTWSGHTIRVPGSAVAGEFHRFVQCFVYTIEAGRIVRIDVYDDAATGRRWNELMTHTRLLKLVQ